MGEVTFPLDYFPGGRSVAISPFHLLTEYLVFSEGEMLLNSSLRITRDADGMVRWSGDYGGMKVVAVLPIGTSDSVVVLLPDASAAPVFQNLLRLDDDGAVLWKAELPRSYDDAFVRVMLSPDGLHANSWSGYRVKLDPATGRIIEREFVK